MEVTDWERANALRQGQWSVRNESADDDGCQVYAGMGPETVTQCFSAADDERKMGPAEEEAIVLPVEYEIGSAREMLARMFNNPADQEP